ncbi:MAG: hypothetical protein ACM3JJ_02415 [Hyphomicrobiales bacterium]
MHPPPRRWKTLDHKRYAQLFVFRMSLAVASLLLAALAGHETSGSGPIWPLAALFAASTGTLLIWPLIVPGRNRTLVAYSLAPAFFLAGMFLLSPAALVLVIAFSVTLAGLLKGARAYRIVFHLAASILAYVGPALVFRLGPRPIDLDYHPALRAGLELMIATFAIVLHLLLRSVAMRLEQGHDTPRWGAFGGPAFIESVYGLVLSVSILVLARIHPLLLGVVYLEIAITAWFVHRYRLYVTDLRRDAEAAAVARTREGAFNWIAEAEEEPAPIRWRPARKVR